MTIDRKYEDGTETDRAEYFTGIEVEKVPCYGKKTLFVTYWQPADKIMEQAHKLGIKNIYLGANKHLYYGKVNMKKPWGDTALELLEAGYTVTIDFPVSYYELAFEVLQDEVLHHRNFTINMGIELPGFKKLNANTTLKIDDKEMQYSNDGIYCFPLKSVTTPEYKTDWEEYKSDKLVK